MKAHAVSLVHALILLAVSAWGYLGSETPSMTALIPGAFGVLLLACYPGVKAENKVAAHVAVVLTFVLLLALAMPLKGAIGRGDTLAIVRVGLMLAATAVALGAFVKSFLAARRARAESPTG